MKCCMCTTKDNAYVHMLRDGNDASERGLVPLFRTTQLKTTTMNVIEKISVC